MLAGEFLAGQVQEEGTLPVEVVEFFTSFGFVVGFNTTTSKTLDLVTSFTTSVEYAVQLVGGI